MSKLFPLRLVSRKDASHEDAILARHDVLVRQALKLTRGNRELAEDLLQDAFVYFTQLKPELDEIQNLDAYLYTILKISRLPICVRACATRSAISRRWITNQRN